MKCFKDIYLQEPGVDDRAVLSSESKVERQQLSIFGIRFYAWSAVLFSEEPIRACGNLSVITG